jgi:ubiquitin-conjugating enzyme E2 O
MYLPTSWIPASASRSSVNVTANKTHLDPCSSGNDTVSVQNHEVESSSTVSSWARTEHGTEITHHTPFSQFDVVQDFSDHHYAKTSAGKVCCFFFVNLFFPDIFDPTTIFPPHNV